MKIVPMVPSNNSVCHHTIDTLELMLEQAKEGKLQSFVGISLDNDMDMKQIYAGKPYNNYVSYLGMLTDLQIDFKMHYEDDNKWKR